MKTKHSVHTLNIVIAAMFAAMVAVMTAFVQIKTPYRRNDVVFLL